MKTIRQRFFILAALSALSLLVSFTFFVGNVQFYVIYGSSFIVLSFAISILLMGFSIQEHKNFIFARLVIENSIIHIQAAEAEQKSKRHGVVFYSTEALDIYISCFGILLGSKVIKFNTEGIHLKKVDIGHDFINIYYGKGGKDEFIRLLHKTIEEEELQDIKEQFRRETGIIPNIIN